jgi:hypothetical protein
MTTEKLTAWLGIARFRVTGNTLQQRTVPERRTVELAPGDIVLRDAKRLYHTNGYAKRRSKGESS